MRQHLKRRNPEKAMKAVDEAAELSYNGNLTLAVCQSHDTGVVLRREGAYLDA